MIKELTCRLWTTVSTVVDRSVYGGGVCVCECVECMSMWWWSGVVWCARDGYADTTGRLGGGGEKDRETASGRRAAVRSARVGGRRVTPLVRARVTVAAAAPRRWGAAVDAARTRTSSLRLRRHRHRRRPLKTPCRPANAAT